ncbi:hypothetical protein LQ51_07305 [Micromonospora sp. HK10]|nr:hypothetical protein LQ51_07305 [Micromonospora sp. HK10]
MRLGVLARARPAGGPEAAARIAVTSPSAEVRLLTTPAAPARRKPATASALLSSTRTAALAAATATWSSSRDGVNASTSTTVTSASGAGSSSGVARTETTVSPALLRISTRPAWMMGELTTEKSTEPPGRAPILWQATIASWKAPITGQGTDDFSPTFPTGIDGWW